MAAALLATPVYAQGIGGFLNKAQKAKSDADKAKKTYDEWNITEKEERQIGEDVSRNLREKYGVVQDQELTKYVSLVGMVLAKSSSRPNLDWKFIILDTDGVNAFAAPGGIIHITRGLLGVIKNEAQLAGALGHEITHVTEKHTINYIRDSKMISTGADAAGGNSTRDLFVSKVSERAYHVLLDGEMSQGNESAADRGGVKLANSVGYSPSGLVDVLKALDARNKGQDSRNGLFASHPATQERINALEKQIASEHLSAKATVDARYKQHVTFDAVPASKIAMDVNGAAGLAGGESSSSSKKSDGKNASADNPPPKKKGLMGGLTSITSSKQNESSQTVASAGARGIGTPDRDAKGGPNKNALTVTITPAELVAFKRGIA